MLRFGIARTAASYKKHLNEELETAISIITTSYLRTEDLIRAVKENLPYINEPVKAILRHLSMRQS